MIDLSIIVERNQRGFSSRNQLSSLLRDLFPKDKRECNLALIVYDSGIVSKISELKSIDSQQMKKFVIQLIDDYCLQEEFAVLGIEMWAKAYRVTITQTETAIQTNSSYTKTVSHTPIPYAKVGVPINGNTSDYELLYNSKNECIIKKFRGFEEKATVIPNIIDGKCVKGIYQNAFSKCTQIESLEISDGIEFIEDGAFADCTNLEKVILPQSLTRIGSEDNKTTSNNGTFENCKIQNINLPDGVYHLGKSVFCNCKYLSEIDLPNRITQINSFAFCNCSSLKKVKLPDKLNKIDNRAFAGCINLNEIQFPDSLKEIGERAFGNCFSIASIILNEGCEKIDECAFENCINLKKFLLSSTVSEIKESLISFSLNGNGELIGTGGIFVIKETVQPSDKRRKSYIRYSNNPNLTIYCWAGTYGLEYARKHDYPVKNAKDFII